MPRERKKQGRWWRWGAKMENKGPLSSLLSPLLSSPLLSSPLLSPPQPPEHSCLHGWAVFTDRLWEPWNRRAPGTWATSTTCAPTICCSQCTPTLSLAPSLPPSLSTLTISFTISNIPSLRLSVFPSCTIFFFIFFPSSSQKSCLSSIRFTVCACHFLSLILPPSLCPPVAPLVLSHLHVFETRLWCLLFFFSFFFSFFCLPLRRTLCSRIKKKRGGGKEGGRRTEKKVRGWFFTEREVKKARGIRRGRQGWVNQQQTISYFDWLHGAIANAVWDLISTSLALGVCLFSLFVEGRGAAWFSPPVHGSRREGRREHGRGLQEERLPFSLAGWSLTGGVSWEAGAGSRGSDGDELPWKSPRGTQLLCSK